MKEEFNKHMKSPEKNQTEILELKNVLNQIKIYLKSLR
jgi:hypothetical protein